MASSDKSDLLASNLLFATLGLTMLYEVAGWISQALSLPHNYFSVVHFNVLTAGALSLFLLIRGGLYYGVRRGIPAAKWLVALGLVVFVYLNTHWQAGMIGGVYFAHFSAGALLLLLTNLLTLAAVAVMFWPAQVAASQHGRGSQP